MILKSKIFETTFHQRIPKNMCKICDAKKIEKQFLVKAEAVAQSFEKLLFAKVSENSQENAHGRVFVVTLQAPMLQFNDKKATNKDGSQNCYYLETQQRI